MRYPNYLKYLHELPLPKNPLWNPGNTRHRIFLPLYWIKLVKNDTRSPPEFVKFECHWQMSSSDVKQYLDKLYNIQISDIRMEIQGGKYESHPKTPKMLSPPTHDRKFAYVQLKSGSFEFPEIVSDTMEKAFEKEKTENTNNVGKYSNKNIERLDIGGWFS
jgi:large subunit ribosomal protein L23